MLARILVPLGSDRMGETALAHAPALAHRHKAQIVVAHSRARPEDRLPCSTRLPAFLGVPTLRELGHDFCYYNQRAVVGAPGMSDADAAYDVDLFTRIFDSDAWQAYLDSESPSPL